MNKEINLDDLSGEINKYLKASSMRILVDKPFSFNGGAFKINEILTPKTNVDLDTEYKTAGNAYFSIFDDDEENAVHIEIDPTWLWSASDIRELIDTLSEIADDLDPETTSFVGYDLSSKDDEILVITYPGSISDKSAEAIRDKVKKETGESKVLIIGEGGHAYKM